MYIIQKIFWKLQDTYTRNNITRYLARETISHADACIFQSWKHNQGGSIKIKSEEKRNEIFIVEKHGVVDEDKKLTMRWRSWKFARSRVEGFSWIMHGDRVCWTKGYESKGGECTRMNAREVGAFVFNEARLRGCSLITFLTSNRLYIVSKDWLYENCYRSLETRSREFRHRYL